MLSDELVDTLPDALAPKPLYAALTEVVVFVIRL
jgi:hypothetical protein